MTRIDRVPLVALAITTLFTIVMIPLSVGQEEAFDTVLYTFLPMSLAITGALIATREPANPIGWIFCALAVGGALTEIGEGYGYVAADHGLKGGAAGEWFSSWSWLTDMLGWTLLLLIFPGGRLPSPRWRWVVAAAGTGCGLAILGQALSSDSGDQFSSGANPLAVDSPLIGVAFLLGGTVLITALLAAVISAVGRFRRATGVERQQLKWFVYAGAILAATVPFAAAFWYRSLFAEAATGVALNAMPVAVGIAILRYRLYDIDVLINRTLVYGALTAALAAVYLASVLLLQLALSPVTSDSGLAVAGSTLAVAALFRPARARIQALVDRRFYRSRYDARGTLERFSAGLRNQVDLAALDGELTAAVRQTLAPTRVSLWLRASDPAR